MNRSFGNSRRGRCYRDPENGWILGVCAGLADHFGLPVWAIRLTAVVLIWFFIVPAIVAYFVAGLLMPEKPLRYCGPGDERTFWRTHSGRGQAGILPPR